MSAAFLGLISCAFLFRFFAHDAEKRFHHHLKEAAPRHIPPFPIHRWKRPLQTLQAEAPTRYAEARPLLRLLWMRRFSFAAFACLSLLAGVWYAPPRFLVGNDLALLQQVGTAIVTLALLLDGSELIDFMRVTSKTKATTLSNGDTF